MPRGGPMRPHLTGIMVLLALAALADTASAQSEIPGHVRNRMLGWSTLDGGAALAVSAGGAAVAGAAASDGCAADDWCVISDKVVVGFSVGISMAAVTV